MASERVKQALEAYANPENWRCARCGGKDEINCYLSRWAGPYGEETTDSPQPWHIARAALRELEAEQPAASPGQECPARKIAHDVVWVAACSGDPDWAIRQILARKLDEALSFPCPVQAELARLQEENAQLRRKASDDASDARAVLKELDRLRAENVRLRDAWKDRDDTVQAFMAENLELRARIRRKF